MFHYSRSGTYEKLFLEKLLKTSRLKLMMVNKEILVAGIEEAGSQEVL